MSFGRRPVQSVCFACQPVGWSSANTTQLVTRTSVAMHCNAAVLEAALGQVCMPTCTHCPLQLSDALPCMGHASTTTPRHPPGPHGQHGQHGRLPDTRQGPSSWQCAAPTQACLAGYALLLMLHVSFQSDTVLALWQGRAAIQPEWAQLGLSGRATPPPPFLSMPWLQKHSWCTSSTLLAAAQPWPCCSWLSFSGL